MMTADRAQPSLSFASRVTAYLPLSLAAGITILVLTFLYKRVSWIFETISDNAAILVAAHDFTQGNYLLRGWTLSTNSYLVELPFYALGIALLGLTPKLMHGIPALLWAITVLLAAWLSAEGPPRELRPWRLLAAFPLIGFPGALLAEHALFATGQVAALALILVACLAFRSPTAFLESRGRQMLFLGALTLSVFHTSLTLWIMVVPLLLVAGFTRLRSTSAPEQKAAVLLAGLALLAALLSKILLKAIAVAGGFTVPGIKLGFAEFSELGKNLGLLTEGLLYLLGVDFFGKPAGLPSALGLLRLLGVGLMLYSVCVVLRTLTRERNGRDLISTVLAASMAIDLAAYALTTLPVNIDTARYLLPAVLFGAILIGRVGVPAAWGALGGDGTRVERGSLPAPALLAGFWLVLYLVPFVQLLRTPVFVSPARQLAEWLAARGLTHGYGPYWSASVVTVESEGRVRVRAILPEEKGCVPFHCYSKKDWYEDTLPAHFLVFDNDRDRPMIPAIHASAKAAFGLPSEVHRVGKYTVLVWKKDITPLLRATDREGC